MGILEIITLKGLLAGWACILILIIPFAIYKNLFEKERRLEQGRIMIRKRRLELERIQKLEEQFLKRLKEVIMKDRFHLEQEIMDCWGVTDDIQTLIDHFETLTEDQAFNALIGLKVLYDMKFNTMFDTFEGLVPTMKIGKDVQEAVV